MFSWESVDGLWATKSEDVGIIVRVVSFQDFQPVVLIHQRHRQTDGRTDGRTTGNLNTALCAVKICVSSSAVVRQPCARVVWS